MRLHSRRAATNTGSNPYGEPTGVDARNPRRALSGLLRSLPDGHQEHKPLAVKTAPVAYQSVQLEEHFWSPNLECGSGRHINGRDFHLATDEIQFPAVPAPVYVYGTVSISALRT